MADFDDLWAVGAKGIASVALGNALLARTSAGLLYGLDGYCGESGAVYIGVFDAAAVVANANPPLTWPKHIIYLSAAGNFGLTLPPVGEYYAKGIWVAVSTTAFPNFTLSTNSVTHFNVQEGPIFGSGQP